jgi:hypothetical protein
MESFFADIEGKAKTILDRLCQTPSAIENDEKETLAVFLSFSFCRVPRSVQTARELYELGLVRVLEIVKEQGQYKKSCQKLYDEIMKDMDGKSISLEKFKDLTQNPHKYVKFQVNEKHVLGESLQLAETFFKCLMRMNWSVCTTVGNNFFITSDAPVNVFLPLGDRKVIFGGGFGMPQVEVMFPVAPKICILMTYKTLDAFKRQGAEFVNAMNKRTVYMAQQYIISPYKSNRINKLVEKAGELFHKPKIDKDSIRERFKKNIKI